MPDVKITSLELENVKRIKAVALSPTQNGLTIIGGRNGQGKTSVLDAIAWALGGDRYKPASVKREGSVLDPVLHVTLSNGLTITRKGPKGNLTVTDENGRRSGQTLLNDFIETLALDLPKFLNASDRDRADMLLGILGLKAEIEALDRQERAKYDTRLQTGRDRDQARHHADSLEWFDGVPEEPVSVKNLMSQLQEAESKNNYNDQTRRRLNMAREEWTRITDQISALQKRVSELDAEITSLSDEVSKLEDIDTRALVEAIQDADSINAKVRSNAAHIEAETRANALIEEYDQLSSDIDRIRRDRIALLDNADMPLPGLSVQDGLLYYNGQPWSCMSSAEQLKAATAIVSRLKPECRFVLVDKLEAMDIDTLKDFGSWAEAQGLQVIGTRVSTGGECSIIIEDGSVLGSESDSDNQTWKEGEF